MSDTETTQEKTRKPRSQYVAIALIILSFLGIDIGNDYYLPERSRATYEEARQLDQTSRALVYTRDYGGGWGAGDYELQEHWLMDVSLVSREITDILTMYAQTAELHYYGQMTDTLFVHNSNVIVNLFDTWLDMFEQQPPEMFELEHKAFVDGLAHVRKSAEWSIYCVENRDFECPQATWEMDQAFRKFGAANGLLTMKLRFGGHRDD